MLMVNPVEATFSAISDVSGMHVPEESLENDGTTWDTEIGHEMVVTVKWR